MSIADKLLTIAENTTKVYEAGLKASGGIAQNPLEYAVTLNSTYLNVTFPENYEMAINVPAITSLSSAFQGATGIVKLIVKGNTAKNIVNVSGAFRINTLEVLDLTEFNAMFGNSNLCCYSNAKLREIKGVINLTNATNIEKMFDVCSALEEVRFSQSSIFSSISFSRSSKLSSETVQSIIDGIATVETALTLTLNSAVSVSDTQKETIEAKGWTLVQ